MCSLGCLEDFESELDGALETMTNRNFKSAYHHYDIKGSTMDTVIQVDKSDNNFEYNLGYYDRREGETSYFKDGTYCPPVSKNRQSQIHWTCGHKFEVTSSSEPSICDYHFEATMPCCDEHNDKSWDPDAGIYP